MLKTIFAILGIIIALAIIGGLIVFKGLSYTFKPAIGGYQKKDGKVYFHTGMQGLGTMHSWEIKEADYSSFRILGKGWAKDKTYAYKGGKRIKMSHGKSFKKINGVYAKDKQHIYYYRTVLSLDVKNFKVTGKDNLTYLAKDGQKTYANGRITTHTNSSIWEQMQAGYFIEEKSVFYKGELVAQADAATFSELTSIHNAFAKDHFQVYINGSIVDKADPVTFEPLPHSEFSRDQKRIFYGKKILSGDADNFRFLSNGGKVLYAKDRSNVWRGKEKLRNASPESFQVFNEHYAADSSHAYFKTKKINLRNAAEFTALGLYHARTNDQVIYEDQVIADADPDSFQSLGKAYGKDSLRAYFRTRPMECSNLDNLEELSPYYARTGFQVFYAEKVLEGVDLPTFQVIFTEGALIAGVQAADKNQEYSWGKPVK